MAAKLAASPLHIDVVALRTISQVLNLLNHRNKNQHRRSQWWKRFSRLRRSVEKLLQEVDDQNEKAAAARVAFMNDLLIPKSYL